MKKISFSIQLVILFSCNKDENSFTDYDLLTGLWKWESNYGEFVSGFTYTSDYKYVILEFASNGTYIEKINDTIARQGTYIVTHLTDYNAALIYDASGNKINITFEEGHLIIQKGDLIETYLKMQFNNEFKKVAQVKTKKSWPKCKLHPTKRNNSIAVLLFI